MNATRKTAGGRLLADSRHGLVLPAVAEGVQNVHIGKTNTGRERAVRPIALHDFHSLHTFKHMAATPLDQRWSFLQHTM